MSNEEKIAKLKRCIWEYPVATKMLTEEEVWSICNVAPNDAIVQYITDYNNLRYRIQKILEG